MKKTKPAARKPGVSRHVLLLIVLCTLVYWNALSGDFLWDDQVQIVKNAGIRDFSNIGSAFTSPFWAFAVAGSAQSNFYRPIQTVAYTIAYALGGLDPERYHVINLGFHILATIFVYLIFGELRFSRAASLLGAAVFGAHPVHTEAVSWIAGVA